MLRNFRVSELSLSKKSLRDFSPSCFQNCKIQFCSIILQFCRCGGGSDAKGHPDGFLSHFSSLRSFQLGRFFDSLSSETFEFRSFSFYHGKNRRPHPLHEVSLSVAALSERLRQLQIARHSRRTCRLSSLSLRGAKRRGNLAVPYRISRKLRRNRNCLPEIAALACGLLAMAHQGGVAVHQRPHTVEYPCTRRSLTAAAGTRCKRFVRFDRRPVHIGSAGPFSTKQHCLFRRHKK